MKKIIYMLLVLSATACGPISFDGSGDGGPTVQRTFSIDNMKLISKSIVDGYDPSTYQRSTYSLHNNSRLLMRFNRFDTYSAEILYRDDNNVYLQMQAQDVTPETAASSLRICPMQKNWMSLATWKNAHPFDKAGHWNKPGGDFVDDDICSGAKTGAELNAELNSSAPGSDEGDKDTLPVYDEDSIYFNLTDWYVRYIVDLNQNFGWLLMSDAKLTMYGETLPSKSPKLLWYKNKSQIW